MTSSVGQVPVEGETGMTELAVWVAGVVGLSTFLGKTLGLVFALLTFLQYLPYLRARYQ